MLNANDPGKATDRSRGTGKDIIVLPSASARGLPPLSSERRANAWMSSNPSSFSGRGPPKAN